MGSEFSMKMASGVASYILDSFSRISVLVTVALPPRVKNVNDHSFPLKQSVGHELPFVHGGSRASSSQGRKELLFFLILREPTYTSSRKTSTWLSIFTFSEILCYNNLLQFLIVSSVSFIFSATFKAWISLCIPHMVRVDSRQIKECQYSSHLPWPPGLTLHSNTLIYQMCIFPPVLLKL